MSGWTFALLAVAALAVVLTALAMLGKGRSPQSTSAWLLFLVVAPWAAIPAWLAFGSPARVPYRQGSPDRPTGFERLLDTVGAGPVREGNRVILLDDTGDARDELFALIESATDTLDVCLFALQRDDLGRDFARRLTERAEAGVKVRLLLDGVGAFIRPKRSLEALRAAGGDVRIHAPVWPPVRLWTMDRRNHRKMVIADGARAWMGGRNVGEDYLGDSAHAWSDLSMRVDGPVVEDMAALFAGDFGGETVAAPVTRSGDAPARLLASGPRQHGEALHDTLLHLVYRAESRIDIATPYFLPTEALTQGIAIAARRGVPVRILLPGKSNHRMADLARGAWLGELIEAGARLYRSPDPMCHAKAVRIDDLALVGSANFDSRSLLINAEMMLMLPGEDELAAVTAWFDARLDTAQAGVEDGGLLRRSVERVVRLASPLL